MRRAIGTALALPAAAQPQQSKLRLNMANTFPGAMVLIGDAAKNKLPAKIARAWKAMKEMQDRNGVQIKRWPPEMMRYGLPEITHRGSRR